MKNLISVVIPCYNSMNTIKSCLESVWSQSYLPYEIVVVDDGSSDDTLVILKEMQKISPISMSIFSQVNSGPSVARNYGVSNANGDWIAFLDSDDIWFEDRIKCHFNDVKRIKNVVMTTLCSGKSSYYCEDIKVISFKEILIKSFFATSGVILKKSVFEEFKFDESMRYSEDARLWLNIAFYYVVSLNKSVQVSALNDKSSFNHGGLSSNLVAMEKGNLSNLIFCYKKKYIGFALFILMNFFAVLKFFRRIFIITLFKMKLK